MLIEGRGKEWCSEGVKTQKEKRRKQDYKAGQDETTPDDTKSGKKPNTIIQCETRQPQDKKPKRQERQDNKAMGQANRKTKRNETKQNKTRQGKAR